MGQKTVRFSDLSGQLIMRDDVLARIVIQEHPDLGDGPVEIETLADEALAMEKETLRVAVLDVYLPGEEQPRRVTMDADAFGALVTEKSVGEMLTAARPVRRAGRPRLSQPAQERRRPSRPSRPSGGRGPPDGGTAGPRPSAAPAGRCRPGCRRCPPSP